ncbi:MAG: stage II sporulation protein P [Clostridia bacterium]|nr:stage II sporulation protein P [Clostridia bacterium]
MTKKRFKKMGVGLLAVTLTALAVGQGSMNDWLQFGKKAALLSVGLQQPDSGAVALSERVEKAAAKVVPKPVTPSEPSTSTTPPTVASPTVPVTKPTSPLSPGTAPKKAANAGTVLEQLVSTGSEFIQGVAVKNRSGKVFDLTKELKQKPSLSLEKNKKEPQVLIVHTHTTEGYLTYDAGFYNPADVERTRDQSRNVCAAGAAIVTALKAAGISAVQDTTIHDSPQYTGAYSRSEQTVKAALKKYPSVKVVLDIHRDAIHPSDTTRVKPTATVNGKKAAQMMIIAGVVSTDSLPHKNWQQNFHFALQLQKNLASHYPDLMRPLYLVASRYNQHLSPGYLLVEIGSDVNTAEEAVYSGSLLGKTLAETLL